MAVPRAGGASRENEEFRDPSPKETHRIRLHNLPKDRNQLCRRVAWLENFYEVLWACQVDGINVPFTLSYQYNRPHAAYFSEGGVIKKVETKLIDAGSYTPNEDLVALEKENKGAVNAIEKMLRHTTRGDNGASLSHYRTGANAMYVFSRDYFMQGDRDLAVEYLSAKEMENFVLFRTKEQNGILQKFVEPGNTKVSSIRAYWTPHLCQLEAVQNVHRADEKKQTLQKKCCTFDGNSVDVSTTVINKNVEKQILALVDKIVEAVKRVLPKGVEIQIMVLHFKASSKGNIFFLYCSSLRLMDEFEVKNAASGAMLPIGVTEGELKRRVFAVTVDRPNTARAQEPQLPPAKGKGSKGRKGKECVLTGAKLSKLNAYAAAHQTIMLHFLWHGMSAGYERLNNTHAAARTYDEELRIGSKHMCSPEAMRRHLRSMLTGNPLKPLVFIEDPLLTEDMLLDDDGLRAAFRLWERGMLELFMDEAEHITEETLSSVLVQRSFLEQSAPVSEDALLALSTTMSDMLESGDGEGRGGQRGAQRRVIPLDTLSTDKSFKLARRTSSHPDDAVDAQPPATRKAGAGPRQAGARFRSVSAPPGAMPGGDEAEAGAGAGGGGGGRWPFPAMSAETAATLAWRLMKQDRSAKFFGQWRGSDWIVPKFDGRRIVSGDVHRTELEFWFRMFALGAPDEHQPDPTSEAAAGMPRMTFTDLEDFVHTAGLSGRFKRSDVAEAFHRLGAPPRHVFDRERVLTLDGFRKLLAVLIEQRAAADKARIESAAALYMSAHADRPRKSALSQKPKDNPPPADGDGVGLSPTEAEGGRAPSVYFHNKVTVIDHVQLPQVHRYTEVDRSRKFLEASGSVQKSAGATRDAADLMATSRVARRMLKHPWRTVAHSDQRAMDVRARVGALPETHTRTVRKPQVVSVQSTVDLAGSGLEVYGALPQQRPDSVATSVGGTLES